MLPIVRVLVVTNDWIGVTDGGFLQWTDQVGPDRLKAPHARDFHLGEFVRVLTATSWSGFILELTKAHRAKPSASEDAAAIMARSGADVVGFRFDQPFQVAGVTRKLTDYDVVLLFPIDPQPHIDETDVALSAEATAIVRFMEAGGGFFATGDHQNLGAPLCRLIPRIRSMRRWYYNDATAPGPSAPGPGGEPPAPSATADDRHDTTQPASDGRFVFENQSDAIPQPLDITRYGAGVVSRSGYVTKRYLPHPLLCSPDGEVTWLPDHMHEGECEVPDNLSGRSYTIDGKVRPEYPPPSGAKAPLAPEIIASGRVLGRETPVIDLVEHSPAGPVKAETFGVIGVWDGHLAGQGRVVVDSTWHHFFNINLTGDLYLEKPEDHVGPDDQRRHGFYVPDASSGMRKPHDQYKMIMWYYRNIVYWLIPANRTESIVWAMLVDITRTPRLAEELAAFDRPVKADVGGTPRRDFVATDIGKYLYFGQLAEDYFRRARGACATYIIHVVLYKPIIPWWEWVQEIISVWNPTPIERSPISELRTLGAMGLAPRPEALLQAGLGAAVIAAARLRRQLPRGGGELDLRALKSAWSDEFAQLHARLKATLRRSAAQLAVLEQFVDDTPTSGKVARSSAHKTKDAANGSSST